MANIILEAAIALNCVTMVAAAIKQRYGVTLVAMALADVCIILLLE